MVPPKVPPAPLTVILLDDDDALRQALATASRKSTYNPGIGAFETATTQEIVTRRYRLDEIDEALQASAEKRDLSGVLLPNR